MSAKRGVGLGNSEPLTSLLTSMMRDQQEGGLLRFATCWGRYWQRQAVKGVLPPHLKWTQRQLRSR